MVSGRQGKTHHPDNPLLPLPVLGFVGGGWLVGWGGSGEGRCACGGPFLLSRRLVPAARGGAGARAAPGRQPGHPAGAGRLLPARDTGRHRTMTTGTAHSDPDPAAPGRLEFASHRSRPAPADRDLGRPILDSPLVRGSVWLRWTGHDGIRRRCTPLAQNPTPFTQDGDELDDDQEHGLLGDVPLLGPPSGGRDDPGEHPAGPGTGPVRGTLC